MIGNNSITALDYTCGDLNGSSTACPRLINVTTASCIVILSNGTNIYECIDAEGRTISRTVLGNNSIAYTYTPITTSSTITGTVVAPELKNISAGCNGGGPFTFWSLISDTHGLVESCTNYTTVPLTSITNFSGLGTGRFSSDLYLSLSLTQGSAGRAAPSIRFPTLACPRIGRLAATRRVPSIWPATRLALGHLHASPLRLSRCRMGRSSKAGPTRSKWTSTPPRIRSSSRAPSH